ncbi:MAG: hypothetical protein NC392_06315 [Roseburia sp.]|nr:hypothetical protein [Roseburia sp.]MCM1202090.1 hypothetical protein [Bacteroides fragilis]
MDEKKRMTGMMIHGFAAAHAVTAALLAQTFVGDEAALTALTVAMIVAVARLNGADWDSGMALAFLGVFIGGYLGVRGATFLVKWIPGVGNAANAAVTFATTEVLGWATYLFIKKGKGDPKAMTQAEKDSLWAEAKNMREKEEAESKRLYESMSEADKKEYKDIMNQLKEKNLPESTRNYLLNRLETISGRYM